MWFFQPVLALLGGNLQEPISHEARDISSTIVSIQSFNDIRLELDSVDQNTLVVFDVDNVLITYNDMVLRPCGSHFRPDSWKDLDPKEIPYLISIMLRDSQIILVDLSVPQLINDLESRGVKTIALTAARTGKFGVIESMEDWRLHSLRQFNIDFSTSFPNIGIIFFDKDIHKENDYPLFKEGILFLGDEIKTKGELLIEFLAKTQWTPKKVIFIDDKLSHLHSVEASLKPTTIAFQGYQYLGVENLPGKLNVQIAENQFFCLRNQFKWLSDSDIKNELEYTSDKMNQKSVRVNE